MAHISNRNYPEFKKAYLKAVEEGAEGFMFEGQEVLTSFAKYVVEGIGPSFDKINKQREKDGKS